MFFIPVTPAEAGVCCERSGAFAALGPSFRWGDDWFRWGDDRGGATTVASAT